MKKLVVLGAILLALGTMSCKKSGSCTCTILGAEATQNYDDLSSDEYDQKKSDCESAGCDWSAI